jgi:NhaP-type Na+/H+ or K+/H+ antiporter
VLLLAFAAVLLLAVLVSALAKRTILSTAVLFLLAGFLLGPGVSGVVDVDADSTIVGTLAELALFAVLFTDGMRVGWADLRSAWRLPGRALGWGLPLTLAVTAVAAHYVVGLGWAESLLIGAILSPTDPVFASALVGNEKVPARLRHLLNVESGVNDGLALPFVIVFLAVAAGSADLHLGELLTELALGLVIGVLIPVGAILLERSRFFSASPAYEPLNGLAIGLLVLAVGQVTHANLFLAAFAAGITVATFGPRQRAAFEHFGENIAELFKLAALLVFGALISPAFR